MSAKCYHESMILIPEECGNNKFKFLEGQISVSNKALSSFMSSKNFKSLLKKGNLEVINAQTFHSFTSEMPIFKRSRFSSVCGRLAAASQYSSSLEMMCISFLHLYTQLRALHYPRNFIKDAYFSLYRSKKEIIWKILGTLIQILEPVLFPSLP